VDKALSLIDKVETLEWIVYFDDRGMWDYDHPQVLSIEDMESRGEVVHAQHPEQFEQVASGVAVHDVAIISYTSGTTGLPKGALLTHEFVLDSGYRLMDAFKVKHGHEYLSYISQAWAAEQICGIALGVLAPMVVSFAEKPETVPDDLRELAPEFLLFTPRQWEMMASGLQASMFDAHPLVRRLYDWAVETGKQHRDAPGLGSRVKMALAEVLVLAGVRAAECRVGAGGRDIHLFPRHRHPAAQPLWRDRIRPCCRPLEGKIQPAYHGPAFAGRSDHRCACGRRGFG
jgi:long-chain acyl-CoA synthetase